MNRDLMTAIQFILFLITISFILSVGFGVAAARMIKRRRNMELMKEAQIDRIEASIKELKVELVRQKEK